MKFDAYAPEKAVIGRRSTLFASTKTGLQVNAIKSSSALIKFITEAVTRSKARVRLSFGDAQPDDDLVTV